MTTVALQRTEPGRANVAQCTRRVVEMAGGLTERIKPGDRVLVKPNLVAPVPEAVTHPDVLSEVVRAVKDIGANVIIGESAGFEYDSRTTFEILRMQRLATSLGVELLNFEDAPYIEAPFEHPLIKKVRVARAAVECDAIINIPRMKCHKLTDVSLGVKNCFGMLHKHSRREVHAKGLHHGIAALYRLFHPAITVLDGLLVPTSGAVYGGYNRYGLVAASTDMLALDMVASPLLMFDPWAVDHIAIAARVGEPEISVVGDQVEPISTSKAGSRWKRKIYRRAFEALYGLDYCLSSFGARTIIPWFHTRFGVRPVIDWSKCNNCKDCVRACPIDAINSEARTLDYNACVRARCLECVNVCPQNAVSVRQAFKM